MAFERRQYLSTRLSVVDEARLGRLDQLLASSELRQRFGARALGGQSAILAALVWIDRGDGEGEHGAPAGVVRWPAAGEIDRLERGEDRLDHAALTGRDDHPESTQALLVESEAGPLDGGADRPRRSSIATPIPEEA